MQLIQKMIVGRERTNLFDEYAGERGRRAWDGPDGASVRGRRDAVLAGGAVVCRARRFGVVSLLLLTSIRP